jgi:poly(3-hydroxybutyrate) depolymerase
MEMAKEKNANVELLTIENAGHSFNGKNISPSMEALNDYAANFITSHLK